MRGRDVQAFAFAVKLALVYHLLGSVAFNFQLVTDGGNREGLLARFDEQLFLVYEYAHAYGPVQVVRNFLDLDFGCGIAELVGLARAGGFRCCGRNLCGFGGLCLLSSRLLWLRSVHSIVLRPGIRGFQCRFCFECFGARSGFA